MTFLNICITNLFSINRKKGGVNVTDVPALKDRFKVISAERKFMIEKTDTGDSGDYTCELKGVSKEFHVFGKQKLTIKIINIYL